MDIGQLDNTEPWDWPGDAGATLLKALTDERTPADDRLVAAELAGDVTVINDEIARALLAIACRSDAPEDLRGQAAIALGPALEYHDEMDPEMDDDDLLSEEVVGQIQSSLQRLYADEDVPRDVRRRALEASIRSPQEWHREAVLDAYDSEDDAWRLSAVFAMRWVPGFDAQVLEALGSADLEVQSQAVCAAGNWALEAAWPQVAGLLGSKDTEKELLLAAIEAAAWIRPVEASEILIVLADSEDEDVAVAAQEAITMAEIALDSDLDTEENPDDDA